MLRLYTAVLEASARRKDARSASDPKFSQPGDQSRGEAAPETPQRRSHGGLRRRRIALARPCQESKIRYTQEPKIDTPRAGRRPRSVQQRVQTTLLPVIQLAADG